jgi:hypothetical protein
MTWADAVALQVLTNEQIYAGIKTGGKSKHLMARAALDAIGKGCYTQLTQGKDRHGLDRKRDINAAVGAYNAHKDSGLPETELLKLMADAVTEAEPKP